MCVGSRHIQRSFPLQRRLLTSHGLMQRMVRPTPIPSSIEPSNNRHIFSASRIIVFTREIHPPSTTPKKIPRPQRHISLQEKSPPSNISLHLPCHLTHPRPPERPCPRPHPPPSSTSQCPQTLGLILEDLRAGHLLERLRLRARGMRTCSASS